MTLPPSYDLLWRLARPALPFILNRRAAAGKEDRARIAERFGQLGERSNLPASPIWIHAVSVGESVGAVALARALRTRQPDIPLLITTNTVTAATRIAAQPAELALTHLYQPLDHPGMVDAFLRTVRPRLALFLESDFWPNLITRTAAADVPVAFVSAQLSNRAFARWQRQRHLAKSVFGTPDLVLAVDSEQQGRFADLGTDPQNVHIGGSLKLPPVRSDKDDDLMAMLRQAAGDRRILLAASTHEGEDNAVIEAAEALGDGWFTIIAPRHPERGGAVASQCEGAGYKAARRGAGGSAQPGDSIYIADTLGEMNSLFSVADIVFLGGSLKPLGGHNPVEPAAHGLPIITGPHTDKNRAEFAGLMAAGVVSEIADAAELAATASQIVDDPGKLARIARAARDYASQTGKRPEFAADFCLGLIDRTGSKS
ncbi:MAG: 3-deoxy-D-manno-octulosonic acid transferase [Candidatus Puniceispirillaceae bacterium]